MKTTEWLSNLDGKVAKDVEKYLGSKPDLPSASALAGLQDKFAENAKKCEKAAETMGDDAKTASATYDKATAEIKKALSQIKDETFGLNAKDKTDLKKITDARTLYTDELTKLAKVFEQRKDSAKAFGKDDPAAGKTASTSATNLA